MQAEQNQLAGLVRRDGQAEALGGEPSGKPARGRDNQLRMNYPEYRKQGLPVNSSTVESLIKEVNYRVKGTEKFWNRPDGIEAILQIRAGVLSDDNRLVNHIKNRPGSPFRRYKIEKAAKAA